MMEGSGSDYGSGSVPLTNGSGLGTLGETYTMVGDFGFAGYWLHQQTS
jgi:hypothetical protein